MLCLYRLVWLFSRHYRVHARSSGVTHCRPYWVEAYVVRLTNIMTMECRLGELQTA